MKVRDKLYKEFVLKKDHAIQTRYKPYRNMIITLMRKGRKNHYADFFAEHQANIKKTWEGIRGLINISKKKNSVVNKLLDGERVLTDKKEMVNAMNSFFVNIGANVEKKIPTSRKHFSTYLQKPKDASIFLQAADTCEIECII